MPECRVIRAKTRSGGSSPPAAIRRLDLIQILLQRGKFRQVRELARESYDTLRSLGVLQEAARLRPYLQ